MLAVMFLALFGAYLGCGVVFALPFVLVGVGRLDPRAAHGSWGFRLMILPGAALLWPLLALRWARGIHEPPVERTAHRCAAAAACPSSRSTGL